MNKGMLDWIAERLDKELTGERRTAFLRQLQAGDNKLYRFVESNLMDWQTMASVESKEIFFVYDAVEASREVVQHLGQFFAGELAIIGNSVEK